MNSQGIGEAEVGIARTDYYDILGVPRTASDKEIKAAYRKLARKFHPDVNPGDKNAEERFKEIAAAFAVVSDPGKRAKYDRGGHEAFGPGFDPFAGTGFDLHNISFGFSDLNDLFEMFGGGRVGGPRRPRRGHDLQVTVRTSFLDAIHGTTLEIPLPRKTVKVRIPPRIEDGGRVRVPGQGDPGPGGGPPGDAYLVIRVEPHPLFRREGRDIRCELPIGMVKATLGGTVEVPTLDGKATITIPPGTRSGQRFRLKGRGVPASGGTPAGDLYAEIQIHPPKTLDARSREILEEFARLNPES